MERAASAEHALTTTRNLRQDTFGGATGYPYGGASYLWREGVTAGCRVSWPKLVPLENRG